MTKQQQPTLHNRIILFVFLGRRGGGQVILEELVGQMGQSSNEFKCVVFKSRANSSLIDGKTECVDFSISHQKSDFLNPITLIKSLFFIFKLKSELSKLKPQYIVQIIPSPFDVFIDYFAKKRQIHIIRLIHDFETHLGESWPTHKALSARISRANSVIVFSRYVESGLNYWFAEELKNKSIDVAQLPRNFSHNGIVNSVNNRFFQLDSGKLHIAFLGRALDYKGLEYLGKALEQIEFPFDFVAGGEGNYPKSLLSKYRVFNYWISDSEFVSIMSECHVLVFPYIEASQSGIIPIARHLHRWILATGVGGLKEQLEGYPRAIIVESGNSDSLAKGLDEVNSLWLRTKNSATFEDQGTKVPSLSEVIKNLLNVSL